MLYLAEYEDLEVFLQFLFCIYFYLSMDCKIIHFK